MSCVIFISRVPADDCQTSYSFTIVLEKKPKIFIGYKKNKLNVEMISLMQDC